MYMDTPADSEKETNSCDKNMGPPGYIRFVNEHIMFGDGEVKLALGFGAFCAMIVGLCQVPLPAVMITAVGSAGMSVLALGGLRKGGL